MECVDQHKILRQDKAVVNIDFGSEIHHHLCTLGIVQSTSPKILRIALPSAILVQSIEGTYLRQFMKITVCIHIAKSCSYRLIHYPPLVFIQDISYQTLNWQIHANYLHFQRDDLLPHEMGQSPLTRPTPSDQKFRELRVHPHWNIPDPR